MVEFKNKKIRVRCMECDDEHLLELVAKRTVKEQRNMGFEYEHMFNGFMKCPNCGEAFRLNVSVFEYPRGYVNYIDVKNIACIVTEQITNNSDLKTRLVEEQVQLEEKIDKLDAFIVSEKFARVDDVQRELFSVQVTAMNTYLQCLKERIERLP